MAANSLITKCMWIGSAGSGDANSSARISVRQSRSTRAGAPPLQGVRQDLDTVETYLGPCLFNSSYAKKMPKEHCLSEIKSFFQRPARCTQKIWLLMYSGHGYKGTGDMVMSDGGVSLVEVLKLWLDAGHSRYNDILYIFMDSCHSGAWLDQYAHWHKQGKAGRLIVGFICACSASNTASDTEFGGDFTIKYFSEDPADKVGLGNHSALFVGSRYIPNAFTLHTIDSTFERFEVGLDDDDIDFDDFGSAADIDEYDLYGFDSDQKSDAGCGTGSTAKASRSVSPSRAASPTRASPATFCYDCCALCSYRCPAHSKRK